MAMTQLLAPTLAAEGMANDPDFDHDVINAAIDSLAIVLAAFLGLLRAVREVDNILFNIPPEEEATPLQLARSKGLRIDDLSNMAALKMTRFNWCQLKHLYAAFILESQLEPMDDKLKFFTGHFYDGYACCYRIHPEEVFLFTLCRQSTGMTQVHIVDTYFGSDKTRWSYAYPWMLRYLCLLIPFP